MSKPIKHAKTSKPGQPIYPGDTVPTGSVLGDDSWHNFAKLGDEFLQASRFTNDGITADPAAWNDLARFSTVRTMLSQFFSFIFVFFFVDAISNR